MSHEIFRILPARSALVAASVLLGSATVSTTGTAAGVGVTKDDGEAAAARKPAGSVVTYTNTIANAAGSDTAAGVQFKDPDMANATYVAGSLQATPVAIDDSYPATVVANSRIDTATSGFSVVDNDFPGYVDGVAVAKGALTISNVGTPAHGTVSMTLSGAGVGRFVYTPTAGYTGPDSFSYTVSNTVGGGAPASITGTVNLTVGGPVIWFVNPAAGVNGDGTLHSPFNNLAAAVSAIGALENQRVFLFSGGDAQTTGIALNAGGWLIGQGATGTTFDALMGATYAADTVTARPAINLPAKPVLSRSSGGNTVTLANNFLIAGLAITNSGGGFAVAGGAGVDAGTIGHATTPDVTIGASDASSGTFSLNGGNGAIAVNAPLTATAGRPVQIQNRTASAVSFTRPISGTANGISLAANGGATVSFTGGLSLTTGSNPAFAVTGGGTVTATQDNTAIVNTIATTTGTALEVANSTIGAAGLTFRSISANGAPNGIRLSATGSGGLTITGNGAANSGGTLQSLSGDGIQLTNASNVSLTDMSINSVGGSWIDATTVTGLTLNRVSADLSTDHGFKANSLTNLSITGGTFDRGGAGNAAANFNGFDITNLLGTSTVTGSTFRRSNTIQFRVNNTSATSFGGAPDSLTVSGTVWNTHTSPFAGDHLSVNAGTGGNFRLVMNAASGINTVNEGGAPSSGGGTGVQATSSGTNGRMDVSITGLKTTSNTAGVVLGQTGGGALTYSVTGNKTANGTGFSGTGSGAIFLTHASGGGTSVGTISDNSITHTAGPGVNALQVVCEGSGATGGSATTVISNNSISGNFQRGLQLQARVANPVLNATVSNNTLNGTDSSGGALQVVNVESGGSGAGQAATVRLNLTGNSVTYPPGGYLAAYRLVNRTGCTFQLQNFAGNGAVAADVQTWVTTAKSNTGTPVTVTPTAAFTSTSSVPQPLLFLPQAEAVATPAVETAAARVAGDTVADMADQAVETATPALPIAAAPAVRQEDFDALVAAAITRWTATGLTETQVARLKSMRFQLSDLPGAQLGQMGGRAIEVNRHAAGHEWHIDPTPQEDSGFSPGDAPTRLLGAAGEAADRVDLLTTLMHEMGHALGLPDLYQSKDRDNLMFGLLPKGERRLPAKDQAMGAVPTDDSSRQFLSGGLNPIAIGNLPPGKSVTITYQVRIDDPFELGAAQLSSQATVSGSNFPDVLSDDPATGTLADATVTLLDRPDTTVVSLDRTGASPGNGASVSWQIVFSAPVINLTASHFSLVAASLGGSPAITGVVNPSAPAASATWTITASTGTGNGTLGLNLANDSGALSHDVTNLPFTGQVYDIDPTPPTATILVADGTLTAGETTPVTITFSEPVTGFDNADLTIPNGTLSAVSSADGGTIWTATLTPDADVTDSSNSIALDNTGVTDLAGNLGSGTTDSNNYAIDTERPSAVIFVADDNLMIGETSPVTITFNEAASGFDNADLTVEGGSLSPVTSGDGGITWTATFTPTPNLTDTTNVITLDNTGVTDDAGNTGTGTSVSNNYAVTSLSVSIAAVTGSAAEGTGPGTTAFAFTVSRTGGTTGQVTMDYAITGAADATDFGGTPPAGVFTLPDGQASAVLTLLVSQDSTREPDETFTVTLSNPGGGYVVATAAANSTITNDDFEADLVVTKTDGVTTATPGGSVTYTITASNAGPDPVTGATVTDTLPASLTGATWTAVGAGGGTATAAGAGNINDTVNLPAGASVTYTVTANIAPSATGSLSNTATASSAVTDPNPANNSATDTDTLTPRADLSITKTDGVTTATPGGSVTYTITATNAGPSDVTGATVADTFPAILNATWTAAGAGGGTATASGSGNINDTVNLPAGASVTYTVTATIASSATGSLSNTATVSSPVTDPNPANNSATDTDTLAPQADLAITKTDGVTTAVPGESVTYTITATNAGPSNVTGATLADTFPASLTATWTAVGAGGGTATASGSGNINDTVNLPAGASVTYTVTATIAPTATGSLSNTATISSAVTDPVPANNSATDTDTLTPRANLAITKTDGVTTATPGGSVTYTITATNSGPSGVTGATVTDTLPASLTATWTAAGAGGGTATASGSGNINDTVDLPVGASVTYTVSATIAPSATGSLSNTATIAAPGSVTDTNPADNSATDTDTLAAQADLAITKTDDVTTATPGGSVTYTITATNAGPSNITGATVSDTLPASIIGATWTAVGAGGGTATASGAGNISDTVNLPAGASVTYTVTAPVSAAATGTLANTATISSDATDPNPGNNSATDTDTLAPQADLAIIKTDGVTTAIPGNTVTYTITASNAGPSNAPAATVSDTLPATLTGVSWTAVGAGGGTATAAGSGNINDSVNLPAGGSVTYTVTGTISSTATGTLSNTATVGSATTDPNPANNSATDTDTLTPQADLAITLTDTPDPVNALGNLTYLIGLTNNGPSAAGSPQITLPLPAGTTFVSVSTPPGWTAATPAVGSSGTVTLSAASRPRGSQSFVLITKVDATIVNDSTLTATATISAATPDPAPGNNSATTTTLARSGADLVLTLADSPDPVFAGNELTYTIGVSNSGPLDAENVSLTHVLPTGTSFVSLALPAGWSASTPEVGSAGTITVTRALFTNAGSADFTVVAKVASSVANATTLASSVMVNSTTVDIVPANNILIASTSVLTRANLGVTMTASPATAPKGTEVTFSMSVTNQGPSDAASTVLSLPLPAHMSFVSATAPSGWTTNAPAVGGTGTVGFSTVSLATGESREVLVIARVNNNAPTGALLTATASVISPDIDPQTADNSASATAAVGTLTPTVVQPVTTGIAANAQSGLYEVNVNVTNTTPNPINGFRLHVDFAAYKAAYPSLRLYNASSPAGAADVYVDYPFPVAIDGLVTLKLSFYTGTRTFPSPFEPQLSVEILPSSQLPDTNGAGVQPRVVSFINGNLLLEFPSVVGKWYRVRYSSDLLNWQDCPVPLQAGSTRMQWIDSGPPFTDVPPSQAPARYYRVNEIAAP